MDVYQPLNGKMYFLSKIAMVKMLPLESLSRNRGRNTEVQQAGFTITESLKDH